MKFKIYLLAIVAFFMLATQSVYCSQADVYKQDIEDKDGKGDMGGGGGSMKPLAAPLVQILMIPSESIETFIITTVNTVTISVTDINGIEQLNETVNTTNNPHISTDVSTLPDGIYTVTIKNDKGKKLVSKDFEKK